MDPCGFEMVAERCVLALLAQCYGAFGGANGGSRATYLATDGCGSEAISLAVYEPNGEDMEETYYRRVVKEMRHKQRLGAISACGMKRRKDPMTRTSRKESTKAMAEERVETAAVTSVVKE